MLGEPKNTADHTQSRKMKKQKSCLCLQDVLNILKDASYLTSAPSPSFIPQKHHSSVCLVHRHPPKLNALYLMLWKGRLQLTYSCTFLLYSYSFIPPLFLVLCGIGGKNPTFGDIKFLPWFKNKTSAI